MALTEECRRGLSVDPRGYLRQAQRVRELIQAKQERIERWRLLAESTTITLRDKLGSGGQLPSSLVENCVCNIVDLSQELAEEIEALAEAERAVAAAIREFVDDATDRTLLELRYLNGLKWEEIADRLDLTVRWVMSLHKNVLEEIARKAL